MTVTVKQSYEILVQLGVVDSEFNENCQDFEDFGLNRDFSHQGVLVKAL